ncbi:hypothetical protein [Streptomyces sp. NPDC002067]
MSEIVRPDPSDPADTQRRGYLAAFETASLVLGLSPIVPAHLRSECPSYAPHERVVDVYFHRSADGVQQLANALGVEVSRSPFEEDSSRQYVEMSAEVQGVAVHAWTLLPADAVGGRPTAAESAERLRAVLAPAADGGRP